MERQTKILLWTIGSIFLTAGILTTVYFIHKKKQEGLDEPQKKRERDRDRHEFTSAEDGVIYILSRTAEGFDAYIGETKAGTVTREDGILIWRTPDGQMSEITNKIDKKKLEKLGV